MAAWQKMFFKNIMSFQEGAEKAVSDFGGKRVELSAQCRVAEFYKKQGYTELNDIHMDEECPHTWMRKEV